MSKRSHQVQHVPKENAELSKGSSITIIGIDRKTQRVDGVLTLAPLQKDHGRKSKCGSVIRHFGHDNVHGGHGSIKVAKRKGHVSLAHWPTEGIDSNS